MKLIAPDYYPQFRCIADQCKHSCCIGWEIDIDEDSLARFRIVDGALGQQLKEHIDMEGTPHFRLLADDQCPFLNEKNLCSLIIELGEDCLCQICADHPRFRNAFSDRTEMGLGLTCEAAAQLILSRAKPVTLVTLEDDGNSERPDEDERALLSARNNALAIVQDRSFSVSERMANLMDFFGFTLPPYSPAQWAEVYLELERLDERWTQILHKLQQPIPKVDLSPLDTAFEQLLVYFIFRHLPAALNDGDIGSKLGFAVQSVTLLQWLCAAVGCSDLDDLTELSRMYSSEIEYSDENLDILFDLLFDAQETDHA